MHRAHFRTRSPVVGLSPSLATWSMQGCSAGAGAAALGGGASHQLAGSLGGHPPTNWGAVIGSLPKGLTNDEKLRVKMSVPPSPSANLLKEMNAVR
jgi:hypothetical protein